MSLKRIIKQTVSMGAAVVLGTNIVLSGIVPIFGFDGATKAEAVWDGHPDGEGSKTVSLMNFNSIGNIVGAGAKLDKKHTVNGNMYSAYWADHTRNSEFYVKSFDSAVPSDWTNYSKLTMDIYSKKATGAGIYTVLYCPNAPDGISYLGYKFTVDWEGWKKVTLNFNDFSSARNGSKDRIIALKLVANGSWSMVGNPETELYIASMNLGGYSVGYDFMTDFYDEETIENAFSAMTDSVAVYAGKNKAVTAEGAKELNEQILESNGTVMVPTSLFRDYLGADVEDNGSTYTISVNGKSIKGNAGENRVIEDTDELELSVSAYATEGVCYVPGEEVARLLGLSAFTDGKLLVMGTQATVEALRRPGNLGVNEMNEVIAYTASSGEVDEKSFSAEDCEAVVSNWKKHLVGDASLNDVTDPDVAQVIKTVNSEAKAAREKLIKDSSDEIFEGIVFNASSRMTSAYSNVAKMAKAYAMYGGDYYKNKELLSDIIYALDWLKEHCFSASGKATWSFSGFNNWWDWQLGSPAHLIDILVCINDSISVSELKGYLEYFDATVAEPSGTAANYCHRSQLIIGSAVLQNNYQKAIKVLQMYQKQYLYVDDNERITESLLYPRDVYVQTKGMGFFTDGSYVFHTLHAMNSLYGLAHFRSLLELEKFITGTKFYFDCAAKENIKNFYFDSFDPVVFETTAYRHVMGRDQNVDNYLSGVEHCVYAFMLSQITDDEEVRDELYSIVKAAYLAANETAKKKFISSLAVDHIKIFKDIIENENILPRTNRKTSKIFYNMDKSVHARDGWGIGVSMSSSRIFNYECINSTNMDGWYMGDGRTEYYISGSDMNGTKTYWNTINKYRLPGTTVDTQERQAVSIYQGNAYLSSNDFVGGVELNGEYSASAMDLESYHADEPIGDISAGQVNPAHKSDLVAKKSYFMLDDGVVCLGSAINAKDNNDAEVLTIVDNPLAEKTVSISDERNTPYKIVKATANQNPEPENSDVNTLDGDFNTKWAGSADCEIVWDLGEVKTLGFINLSLQNGQKRQQYLKLQISSDANDWETVFDGASSGKKDKEEAFDLKGKEARYVKYVNGGNSAGNKWVSITECAIYPPNADGTIGTKEVEIYGNDMITVDGNAIELLGEEKTLDSVSWVNYNNKVGYFFPQNASQNAGKLKCRWTKSENSHFELWYSHGVNPTDGGYAYVLLPGMTNEQTAKFAGSNNITVLANTEDIQAAKDNRTGVTYITFWKAGSIAGVTANQPCMVIMQETQNGVDVSISDPTQKITSGRVTVDKKLTCLQADEYSEVSAMDNSTIIDLNFKNSVGRTYAFKFAK